MPENIWLDDETGQVIIDYICDICHEGVTVSVGEGEINGHLQHCPLCRGNFRLDRGYPRLAGSYDPHGLGYNIAMDLLNSLERIKPYPKKAWFEDFSWKPQRARRKLIRT